MDSRLNIDIEKGVQDFLRGKDISVALHVDPVMASCAVSLKRIADALDRIASIQHQMVNPNA